MIAAEPRFGGDCGDGQARSGEHVIDGDEGRDDGTVRPGHIGRLSAGRGAVGEPVVQEGGEARLPQMALKSPTISMRVSLLRRTDWSMAAIAAVHSRQ
jgi:hypothetical protein